MLERLLTNHVLANFTFIIILSVGVVAYMSMPREQDPEINFNWINILTILPGASATDVEKRVTDPIEDALNRSVGDIDFVSSTSRESVSNILVRFNQLDERTFDKRVADLRREVQNVYTDQLPADAEDPVILEITSSNGFPTATIVLQGKGEDEGFRKTATNIRDEIERIEGVDRRHAVFHAPPWHRAAEEHHVWHQGAAAGATVRCHKAANFRLWYIGITVRANLKSAIQ